MIVQHYIPDKLLELLVETGLVGTEAHMGNVSLSANIDSVLQATITFHLTVKQTQAFAKWLVYQSDGAVLLGCDAVPSIGIVASIPCKGKEKK